MSDLPSLEEHLVRFKDEVSKLKRGFGKYRQKPHKLIVLIALVDLFELNPWRPNEIYFNEIVPYFESNFTLYSEPQDWCQPSLPYFHLRTADFWHHLVKSGREEIYNSITTAGGGTKRILDNI